MKGIIIVLDKTNTSEDHCNFVHVSGDDMLDILYTHIDCDTVERVSLSEDFDLICDENGLMKQYDFGWKIELSEDKNTIDPILGNVL